MEPIPLEPIPPGARTPQELLDELRGILEQMHALGIRLNPSSRFRVYQAVLDRAARGDPVDEQHRAQAHLEVAQLVEIGRGLLRAPTPAVIRKMQQVVGDPVLPSGARSQSIGRDTQFEMVMGSRFAAGGLVVDLEEPDMVVHTDSLSIGIAAKRIKSPDLLPRRLNEARGQLLRQGTRITHGVIALDVTFMTNPAGAVVISEHFPTALPVAAQLTARPVDVITRTVQSWARSPGTLRLTCGVLVTASATQYTTHDGGVIQSSHVRNLILDLTSKHALARLRAAAER